MPTVGFEPTISAGERLYTYALDRAATGTGTTTTTTTNTTTNKNNNTFTTRKVHPTYIELYVTQMLITHLLTYIILYHNKMRTSE